MSATTEIPQIHLSNATDAILQDPRLDWLTDRVAHKWYYANEEKNAERGAAKVALGLSGLRAEDLPEMNLMIRQMIGQHILHIADAMNVCAVMFADPSEVAERLTF